MLSAKEVSTYGRLKMQCLCVDGTTTKCLLTVEDVSVHRRYILQRLFSGINHLWIQT